MSDRSTPAPAHASARTPARTRARTPGERRQRRGATIVVVTVALVPLLALASLAVDVSWWQVGAEQLQNAADAAALAGAGALRDSITNASGIVDTRAAAVAAQNVAFGTAVSSADTKLDVGVWTPGAGTAAGTFAVAGSGQTPNAVRVTLSRRAPTVFSGAVRAAAPTVSRTAIAWMANVDNAVCSRPLGLPWEKLWALAGNGSAPTSADTALSASARSALARKSSTARTVTFEPAWSPSQRNDSTWQPMSFDGNNSKNDYDGAFSNAVSNCKDYSAAPRQTLTALNGQGVLRPATTDGMQTLCGITGSTTRCNGTAGRDLRVAWVSSNSAGNHGNGGNSNTAETRMITAIRVLCYYGPGFTGSSDCAAAGNAGKPEGTLVLTVLPSASQDLLPGDTFGNTPSGLQRLVLVK